jgi:hypothetical protein
MIETPADYRSFTFLLLFDLGVAFGRAIHYNLFDFPSGNQKGFSFLSLTQTLLKFKPKFSLRPKISGFAKKPCELCG